MPKQLVQPREAARRLRRYYGDSLQGHTVREWCERGDWDVEFVETPGGQIRIRAASLQAHIDGLKAQEAGR